VLAAANASAQNVPMRRFSIPEATSIEGFTKVSGIHELRDGRLVVVDERDKLVHVLDSGLAGMRQLGRQGAGPREYGSPSRVYALGGDSCAIDDMQNARMLIVRSDGTLGGTTDRYGRGRGANARNRPAATVHATDARGYFYAQAPPSGNGPGGSYAALLRWRANSQAVDTMVRLPLADLKPLTRGDGGIRAYEPPGPFATHTQWAVASDGRIAVVNHQPYRVDIVMPDGSRRQGPAIAFKPLRLTNAHKDEWRKEAAAPRLTLITREGRRTVQSVSWPVQEPKAWPDYLPPFLPDALHCAPNGHLWVERTTLPGSGRQYDVFDRYGRLVERASIPVGRKLIGFGENAVYLIRRDDLDLEYVERYRM